MYEYVDNLFIYSSFMKKHCILGKLSVAKLPKVQAAKECLHLSVLKKLSYESDCTQEHLFDNGKIYTQHK